MRVRCQDALLGFWGKLFHLAVKQRQLCMSASLLEEDAQRDP